MKTLHIPTIKHRADFVAAAACNRKFVKPSVVIQCRERPLDAPFIHPEAIRAGFTATRKLGGAVIRNRVKRRLRAAAAELLPILGVKGRDYVFIGRPQALLVSFDDLIRDIKHALKRLADPMITPPSTPAP